MSTPSKRPLSRASTASDPQTPSRRTRSSQQVVVPETPQRSTGTPSKDGTPRRTPRTPNQAPGTSPARAMASSPIGEFDLIFLVLDPSDEAFDRRLATHLVSLYYSNPADTQHDEESVSMALMRDYIAFAKENVHPVLSEAAQQRLIDAYVDMRRVGSGRGQISAYPRQLKSLIRLAEARARCRLSDVVELCDVDEAARLHREALKQSATDPASGRIDVGILTTGLGAGARRRRADLRTALATLLQTKSRPSQLATAAILTEINNASQVTVTREQLDEALRDLQDEGKLLVVNHTHIRLT